MKTHSTREEALDAMTRALGMALANWQSIEMALFFLYTELCGKTDKSIAGAIFNSMSLETKMMALTALIKVRTSDKKYMQDWDTLFKAFSKQKRLRDKMAHWSIIQSNPVENGEFVNEKFVAFLAPPASDIPRMLKALRDPENSEAVSAEVLLEKSIEDFGSVNEKIEAFRKSLPAAA
jgi:hypothetical protein